MVSPDTLNFLLALGTLVMQLATIVLCILFFFGKKSSLHSSVSILFQRWGIWIGLFLTLLISLLTLYYSEIVGYPPCPLCWWQRVFLYPQIVLFALALWKKDRTVTQYSIALSLVGFGIALYHHALQVLPSGSLPCPAEGTVSCAQRFIFEFGYITFPLMAATLFAFLIATMLFTRPIRA